MKINNLICLALVLLVASCESKKKEYQPTFESLEQVNPVPEWFKDAKFGIYFHWGVFSVPAYANEWYPRNMYMKGSAENKHHLETYGEPEQWPYSNFITGAKDKKGNFVQFGPKLKSEGGNFDPEEWAQLFADAGAKFAGPVAEHHDGFSMWASKVNPWNSKDMGPGLDLAGLFTDAIRKRNMKVFMSMHHAYNITGYYEAVPPQSDPKLKILFGQQGKEKNEELWLNKHKEIIDFYKPDIIYQDFNLHKISQPVLLQFLAYYYNQAAKWNKEVVATFKDGLNTKCAVLDYERGGPQDLTENYWLTDDAISSTSWCYTEGISYYSKISLLHAFIDRISKNGNMILNISPKADGTIPQEQKDVLLAMGDWLKKYGEAIYGTRAWEKYGEGPTKMGAAHGVMGAPKPGTASDTRFTRTKDNSTLFAILLGWEKGQKEVKIKSLNPNRVDLKNLKTVELINGAAGKYLPLTFKQDTGGLTVNLPDKSFEDMAYVLKLSFDGKIPHFNNYADFNPATHYYIASGKELVLNAGLNLIQQKREPANEWSLEPAGKGFYKIINLKGREALETSGNNNLTISEVTGKDNQVWKIENSYNGFVKISNKQFPEYSLSNKNNKALWARGVSEGWTLKEVCEKEEKAYKPHSIPGTIEAEDFDSGCPGEAYLDRDEANQGGQYRPNEGVDIQECSAGTYNIGWTVKDEWLNYTVKVKKSATNLVKFYIASAVENSKLHLECDGINITGIVEIPNTKAYQNWDVLKRNVKLDAGEHKLKLVIDQDGLNLDKMVFEVK
jgi:alpha-L-fucosidase